LPALGRLRQEDHEFKTTMSYIIKKIQGDGVGKKMSKGPGWARRTLKLHPQKRESDGNVWNALCQLTDEPSGIIYKSMIEKE
jgi:hypothetical protein